MTLFVRFVVPFIVVLILSTAGVLGYRSWYVERLHVLPFLSQPTTFTYKQPSQAKNLQLMDVVGNVSKLTRNGDAIPLVAGSLIMQGESVFTDATSAAKLTISDAAVVDIGFNSSLDTVSLIPDQLTFSHERGEIRYATVATSAATVRALHALVKITNGSVVLTVDPSTKRITSKDEHGEITFAYQDTDHNTYVVSLPFEPRAYYDDNKRIITRPRTRRY